MQKLKLSSKTLSILKNFSTICSSLYVRPGNVISTISSAKTIMATAKVEETFENEFAIYDISRFISALSMFKEPSLQMDSKKIVISEGKKKLNYGLASPKTVIIPPEKALSMPSEDIEFTLTQDMMQDVMKVVSVMRLTEVVVRGDGKKITFGAVHNDNKNDDFAVEVGESDQVFTAVFSPENMKLLPGDYKVILCKKGLSKFIADDLIYFVAIEANSSFE